MVWCDHQHSEMKAAAVVSAAALSRYRAVVGPVPDIARVLLAQAQVGWFEHLSAWARKGTKAARKGSGKQRMQGATTSNPSRYQ